MNEKEKTLKAVLEALDNRLSPDDFVKAFEIVQKRNEEHLKKISDMVGDAFNTHRSESKKMMDDMKSTFEILSKKHTEVISEAQKQNDSTLSGIRRRFEDTIQQVLGKVKVKEKLDALISEHEYRLSQIKDGEPGKPGKDGSPDTADAIREKLHMLTPGNRLHIANIDGADALFQRMKKVEERPVGSSDWSSAGGGKIVKSYDLSSKLDGVTTTFSLPSFWIIISVHLSSVPNILRPTTDYTVDGTLMQITFTSQIDPSTSLAAGQSCIIVYSEP
ncbi:MAG: hypothetical protein ACYC9R_13090 [Nitrosotalea sp.]